MIPSDLAARLRLLVESTVLPLTAAHKIPANLPDFQATEAYQAGQRMTALIQSPLPDGSFQALVAGRTLTLALPHNAQNGDVLELVVTGQKNATVNARLATEADLAADTLPSTTLSQTGKLISQLLTGRFGEAGMMPLGRGEPLLPSSTDNPQTLSRSLQQAVSQSGLFYESHLKSWAEGRLPLSTLLQEPQGSVTQALVSGATEAADVNDPLRAERAGQHAAAPAEIGPASPELAKQAAQSANEQAQLNAADGEAHAKGSQSASAHAATSGHIPETVLPIIHQQLETLATHQMQWQFQPWPGMQVEWNLIDPEGGGGNTGQEGAERIWRSNLRLRLPNLGDVDATLVFDGKGLNLYLDTTRAATAVSMRTAGTELTDALAAAGIALGSITVAEHASA